MSGTFPANSGLIPTIKPFFHLHVHALLPESGAHQGPVGLLGTLLRICVCVCVCLSVRSINVWASNGSLNGGSTWRPRPPKARVSSGPVQLWSPTPGQLLHASWLSWLYFSSSAWAGHVRSVVAHSLPARFERSCTSHESAWLYCFNASSGFCRLAKSGPPPSYRDGRSRDRERGLSKLSGVDEL